MANRVIRKIKRVFQGKYMHFSAVDVADLLEAKQVTFPRMTLHDFIMNKCMYDDLRQNRQD